MQVSINIKQEIFNVLLAISTAQGTIENDKIMRNGKKDKENANMLVFKDAEGQFIWLHLDKNLDKK